MPARSIPSPLGTLTIRATDDTITAIDWDADGEDDTPLLREAARQLAAYFSHDIKAFDLPLHPKGDSFQQSVCAAMRAIPYGETRTYGEIARDLDTYGQPVGAACGANPIPILIPCHRVLSATGLGGFSGRGGVETKIALLRHEGGYPFLV